MPHNLCSLEEASATAGTGMPPLLVVYTPDMQAQAVLGWEAPVAALNWALEGLVTVVHALDVSPQAVIELEAQAAALMGALEGLLAVVYSLDVEYRLPTLCKRDVTAVAMKHTLRWPCG